MGLTLLPGCRLYEFLTGTGCYQVDPFVCPNCTSTMLMDGGQLVLMDGTVVSDRAVGEPPMADELTDGGAPGNVEPYEDSPYVEEDFRDSAPAGTIPFGELSAPEYAMPEYTIEPQPSALETMPPEGVGPELEFSEPTPVESPLSTEPEPSYELNYADPDPNQPPSAELPSAQPSAELPSGESPGQSSERPLENPFPLESPNSDLDANPSEPFDEMPPADSEGPSASDLFPPEPAAAEPSPTQPAPAVPPAADSAPGDPNDRVDELDLFDDTIDPDLQLDLQLPPDNSHNNSSKLPRNIYRNAERPPADSFYGRCLPAPIVDSESSATRVAKRNRSSVSSRRRTSERDPFQVSETMRNVTPKPGRRLFDAPKSFDDSDARNVRASYESESTPRR